MGPGRPTKPSELRYVDEDQDIAHVIQTVSDEDEDDNESGPHTHPLQEDRGEGRLAGLSNGHHVAAFSSLAVQVRTRGVQFLQYCANIF
jgi:hypothetical protein